MLSKLHKNAYLDRIHFNEKLELTADCLRALHLAHLTSIPFENLDIPFHRRISLTQESILDKLLEQKRGGFCYELNYAFSLLLNSIGFQVKLLSASVFDGIDFGKDFDHLLLLVNMDNKLYIADVGFGDCFREPLALDNIVSSQLGAHYKIEKSGENYTLLQKKNGEKWTVQYMFSLHNHDIADFNAMCHFHQTSAESNFTKKSVCSIATEQGRISISNGRLITTSSGRKSSMTIPGAEEYKRLLLKHFEITLPENLPLKRLLSR